MDSIKNWYGDFKPALAVPVDVTRPVLIDVSTTPIPNHPISADAEVDGSVRFLDQNPELVAIYADVDTYPDQPTDISVDETSTRSLSELATTDFPTLRNLQEIDESSGQSSARAMKNHSLTYPHQAD
eukprot:GHVH01008654.1.p1 GENE.GHVH01008654.1~~GHVH01008654.1.p1  ORF type:complete len:127 (+),score=21.60 GHVH01008654.1:29-409(+)